MSKMRFTEFKRVLDPRIYSAEAVRLAAVVFSGTAEIGVSGRGGALEMTLKGERAELSGREFLNEVLNQQCRIDLAKKNSKIAGIIVTKALLSATGETRKS